MLRQKGVTMTNFSDFNYCPLVRTRNAEMNGFSHLEQADKEKTLPVFVASKLPRTPEDTINPSFEKCIEVTNEGQPFIFALTRLHQHGNDEIGRLRDESNGYKGWLDFLKEKRKEHESFIPSVILDTDANIRNIVKQSRKIEDQHGKFAVHVSCKFSSDMEMASLIAASVDETDNALFILDLGYINENTFSAAKALAINNINRIRTIDSNFDIVLAASSYPKSAAEYNDRTGMIPIKERDLFCDIGGEKVAIFGDYASIHPNLYDGTPRGWVPRIDYSLEEYWYFYRLRNQNSAQAYTDCAKNIVESENWTGDITTWAENEIQNAANGTPSGKSPAHWISVRVNQHLHVQANTPPSCGNLDGEDYDFME